MNNSKKRQLVKKTKTIKSKMRKTLKNHDIKYGGKVIASGGYGCIFRPALKCVDEQRAKGQISKLMTLKNLDNEYNDIVKFKPFLQQIPNYENYFFIDGVYTCKPDKLTDGDLKNYDKKCKALKKAGIYKNDVNNNLDKIGLLNMPDGGLDVGDFVDTTKQEKQYIYLNDSLIDLLLNGIEPMNKLNIYHGDVKESNILVSTKNGFHTKLIDWGLSAKFDGKTIPNAMADRPFQYNLPFSLIFFNDTFTKMYEKLLKEKASPTYFEIRTFLIDYIFLWNEKRGPGHIKYMINVMLKLFENDLQNIDEENRKEIVEMEFLYFYIIEYLTQILQKYTRNGRFMKMDYFTEVFLKNIDVWGLVMTYYPIVSILSENYKKLDKRALALFSKLKKIFIHYLFETATEPINVQKLTTELKELNSLFKTSSKNKGQNPISSYVKTHSFRKNDSHNTTNKKKPRTLIFIHSNK